MARRTGIHVARHRTVEDFEQAALDFLVAREPDHNLQLGVLAGLRSGRFDPGEAFLATLHGDDGAVVGVAMHTPPYPLGLSCIDRDDLLEPLADTLADEARDVPGVLGPAPLAAAFADAWGERQGVTAIRNRAMRTHVLTEVVTPKDVPGRLRDAGDGDLDLLATWFARFDDEIAGEADAGAGPAEPDPEAVRRLLEADGSGFVVWQDGEVVSMAGYGGPTPNGIRISAVYTPFEHRGRGYASACVAALSQRLLEDGRRFCFLFTDLANPTSNAIYRRIGYEPVLDIDEFRFVEGR